MNILVGIKKKLLNYILKIRPHVKTTYQSCIKKHSFSYLLSFTERKMKLFTKMLILNSTKSTHSLHKGRVVSISVVCCTIVAFNLLFRKDQIRDYCLVCVGVDNTLYLIVQQQHSQSHLKQHLLKYKRKEASYFKLCLQIEYFR